MPAPRIAIEMKDFELTDGLDLDVIAFTPDGRHLIGGDSEGQIRRWRIPFEAEEPIQVEPTMKSRGKVYAIAVSRDGKWIFSGGSSKKVIAWDTVTHKKAFEITEHKGEVNALDLSDSAQPIRIASGSDDKTVRIFKLVADRGYTPLLELQHDDSVCGVKFSPSGNFVATATFDFPSVRIYDSHSGVQLFEIPVRVQGFPVTPLAWGSDSQLFAVSPGKITSFDTLTSSCSEWKIRSKESRASIVTNGRFIACAVGLSIPLWDSVSRKQVADIKHTANIRCMALSPDCRHLVCFDDMVCFHLVSQFIPNISIMGRSSDELKAHCRSLCLSGRIPEMVDPLIQIISLAKLCDKATAHCQVLQWILTTSGAVSLLSWTGEASTYNSCLPDSPLVYKTQPYAPPVPSLEEDIRKTLSQLDTVIISDHFTSLQRAYFVNSHLLLPCVVFPVQCLFNDVGQSYHALVTWLGEVEFQTRDVLPLEKHECKKLVFVHPWIPYLCDSRPTVIEDSDSDSDPDSDLDGNSDACSVSTSDTDVEMASNPQSELVPPDTCTRALQLVGRLGQPFNALLLLKQPDGTYKRVACDSKIIVSGLGANIPKDIRARVIEVV